MQFIFLFHSHTTKIVQLQVVLNTFEAQPLTDEEGNASHIEEEATAFNIKYLTSSKLMGLEVINTIQMAIEC